MPQLPQNAYTFVSRGLPENTFTVVRFSGEEGLSTLYKFEILLVSEQEDVDLEHVLHNPATFTIKGHLSGGEDLPYHGILTSFEQLHQVDRYVFYKAELRPKAWWLTLTRHNQVFLDMAADKFVEAVFMDAGLRKGEDFDIRLTQQFPPHEYVCQYMEFHFDFVSRWAEYGGAYYWFEQSENTEKMICTDSKIAHTPLPGFETFTYSPPSGLDADAAGQVIKAFTLKQRPMPKKVMLRDYNYMRPDLEMKAQSDVLQDRGFGEIYLWADRFRTQGAGDYLANVRAELFKCMEKVFRGVSSIPAIRPGYLFTLAKHYRQDFNGQYLTTTVRHEGSQERYLVGGLGVRGIKDKEALFYRNSFECIPGETQFRPMIKAQKPVAPGNLVAKVDAAGAGQYAELDEHGRYKVIMPFDLSGREGGKASCWLRMMTPYAGEGHGMHFPLLKGAEVMIGFEQGDIDRPFIAGAVYNPEKPNLVTDKNAAINAIRSAGGNELVMGDERGKEFCGIYSPFHHSSIALGAVHEGGEGSIVKHTEGKDETFVLGDKNTAVVGTMNTAVGGSRNILNMGMTNKVNAGTATNVTLGLDATYTKGKRIKLGESDCTLKHENEYHGLKSLKLTGGHAPQAEATVNDATKALIKTLIGTAAGAAGTSFTTECFKGGCWEGEDLWSRIGGGVTGGVFALLGTILSTYGAISAARIVDEFKRIEKRTSSATITLDINGVTIESPKEIVIKIVDLAGVEKSSIVLDNEGTIQIESSTKKETVKTLIEEIEDFHKHVTEDATIKYNTLNEAMENHKSVVNGLKDDAADQIRTRANEITTNCTMHKTNSKGKIVINGKMTEIG